MIHRYARAFLLVTCLAVLLPFAASQFDEPGGGGDDPNGPDNLPGMGGDVPGEASQQALDACTTDSDEFADLVKVTTTLFKERSRLADVFCSRFRDGALASHQSCLDLNDPTYGVRYAVIADAICAIDPTTGAICEKAISAQVPACAHTSKGECLADTACVWPQVSLQSGLIENACGPRRTQNVLQTLCSPCKRQAYAWFYGNYSGTDGGGGAFGPGEGSTGQEATLGDYWGSAQAMALGCSVSSDSNQDNGGQQYCLAALTDEKLTWISSVVTKSINGLDVFNIEVAAGSTATPDETPYLFPESLDPSEMCASSDASSCVSRVAQQLVVVAVTNAKRMIPNCVDTNPNPDECDATVSHFEELQGRVQQFVESLCAVATPSTELCWTKATQTAASQAFVNCTEEATLPGATCPGECRHVAALELAMWGCCWPLLNLTRWTTAATKCNVPRLPTADSCPSQNGPASGSTLTSFWFVLAVSWDALKASGDQANAVLAAVTRDVAAHAGVLASQVSSLAFSSSGEMYSTSGQLLYSTNFSFSIESTAEVPQTFELAPPQLLLTRFTLYHLGYSSNPTVPLLLRMHGEQIATSPPATTAVTNGLTQLTQGSAAPTTTSPDTSAPLESNSAIPNATSSPLPSSSPTQFPSLPPVTRSPPVTTPAPVVSPNTGGDDVGAPEHEENGTTAMTIVGLLMILAVAGIVIVAVVYTMRRKRRPSQIGVGSEATTPQAGVATAAAPTARYAEDPRAGVIDYDGGSGGGDATAIQMQDFPASSSKVDSHDV